MSWRGIRGRLDGNESVNVDGVVHGEGEAYGAATYQEQGPIDAVGRGNCSQCLEGLTKPHGAAKGKLAWCQNCKPCATFSHQNERRGRWCTTFPGEPGTIQPRLIIPSPISKTAATCVAGPIAALSSSRSRASIVVEDTTRRMLRCHRRKQ